MAQVSQEKQGTTTAVGVTAPTAGSNGSAVVASPPPTPAPKINLGFKLFCHGTDVDKKGRARRPPLPRHPNPFQCYFDCGNILTPIALDGRDVQLVCKRCGASARCNAITGCEFHRTEKLVLDATKCWCGQDYESKTAYIGMKLVMVTECPTNGHAWWYVPIEDDIETQIVANNVVTEEFMDGNEQQIQ